MRPRLLFIICLLQFNFSSAQSYQLSGRIIDASDSIPLHGATIFLQSPMQSEKHQTTSGVNGDFILTDLGTGKYNLTISYIGYKREQRVYILKESQTILLIGLTKDNTALENVTVKEKQVRSQQFGDTIQFNASAFKVHPDATAEDLIKKMPGITSDNDGLKSNGETIKKVLVDGKPFFGDDPNAAIKNLPADMVDKVQVFDNQSDQANFTGFRDLSAERAINITTKSGKNVGQFGKVYGGLGTNNRYQAGGNINYFNGPQRLSVLALSNNINQQNFSISDIMNVMSNSGGLKGGLPAGPPPGTTTNSSKKNSGRSSDTGPTTFLAAKQPGITATQSVGLNYSDNWGEKVNISGSYFFNYTNNENQTNLTRKYFGDSNITYRENSTKLSINQNHRLNFRLEYLIDKRNMITITPKIIIQKYGYHTNLDASNDQSGFDLLGSTRSTDSARSVAYNFSNNLLYQHRFKKERRTVSLNFTTQFNNQDGSGVYNSSSNYDTLASPTILDQRYTSATKDYTISGTVTYTEPIGINGQLLYSYTPSLTSGKTYKETKSKNAATNEYTNFDTSLSNRYNNTYVTHKNGLSYKYQKNKTNFSLGADIQMASLRGSENFPNTFSTRKNFNNILPSGTLEYRISKGENLLLNYRTATTAPTVSQLQSVLDISNPLQLSTGNPGLRQTYEHNVMARYAQTNTFTSRSFFLFAMGNYTSAYISNALIFPSADTVVNNYSVTKGSQITLPVNLNGYWSGRAFGIYSLPVSGIKSNLNLNMGITYSRTPTLINHFLNYSNSITWNGGFYLGSNINQNLDFSLSYNGNYNIVRNTSQIRSNNSYYYHIANFKINYILHNRVVFNTDVAQTLYTGLEESYNQHFFLWNASVGYKFLKTRSLEAKLYIFDILNQNRNVSRDITDAYIQDNTYQVLSRYAILSLTYTIKNFKKGSVQPDNNFAPPPGLPPPPKE